MMRPSPPRSPIAIAQALSVTLVLVLASASASRAQQPGVMYVPAPAATYAAPTYAAPTYAAPVCPQCGQVHSQGQGLFGRGAARVPGAPGGGGAEGNPYVGPNQLPRGRVYYNGQFFGGFNNRFYGPQYGYF